MTNENESGKNIEYFAGVISLTYSMAIHCKIYENDTYPIQVGRGF